MAGMIKTIPAMEEMFENLRIAYASAPPRKTNARGGSGRAAFTLVHSSSKRFAASPIQGISNKLKIIDGSWAVTAITVHKAFPADADPITRRG